MNFKGNIISAGNNAKTIKGDGKEYVTAIFYGTPFKMLIEKAGKNIEDFLRYSRKISFFTAIWFFLKTKL